MIGQVGMVLNRGRGGLGWILQEEFFHPEGGDALEQVVQGGCGCPIPGGIQGQAGCGSGQPGLLVGDPAHSRGLELHEHCGPFQPRPFYDSVKKQKPCACLKDVQSHQALAPHAVKWKSSLPYNRMRKASIPLPSKLTPSQTRIHFKK